MKRTTKAFILGLVIGDIVGEVHPIIGPALAKLPAGKKLVKTLEAKYIAEVLEKSKNKK